MTLFVVKTVNNAIITTELLSDAINASLAATRSATSAEAANGYRETLISLLVVWERMTGRVHEVDAELPSVTVAQL